MYGRFRFVSIDEMPGAAFPALTHITSPDFRRSRKDLAEHIAESVLLLNAEISRSQVQVHVDRVAHRRNVRRSMPRRSHAKHFASGGDLARGAQSADGRDVTTDEVDPTVRHERKPFVAIDE